MQGVCALNNGYQDFKGDGVESAHRSFGATKDGYNDGGEPFVHSTFRAFGGEPFHHHYPMQMFDRKLRPMDTCFVGLVCTKRKLTDAYRERLIRQSPRLRQKRDDHARANPSDSEAQANEAALPAIGVVQSFYTFHFVRPSRPTRRGSPRDRRRTTRVPGCLEGVEEMQVRSYGYAEPSAKKATKHYEEAKQGETYDPYIGPSRREFEGMVGAWKVGKCSTLSAKKRDQYTGGPVDTTTAVTVNVNLEFKDWRALRRSFDRPDIGMRAPGARPWTQIALSDVFSERLQATAPGTRAADALLAAALPSLDDLTAAQSQFEGGYTNPSERPGSSQEEIDKYNAWIAYLWVHARSRALFRLQAAPDAPLMDEVNPVTRQTYYRDEITEVLGQGASARDDQRVMQWPTMYQPLLADELDGIRTAMETRNEDLAKNALIAYPPQRPGEANLDFEERDNVRYKLLTNMPLDPRTLETLQDLIGPSDLPADATWGRSSLGSLTTPVDAERRLRIRRDAFRRAGFSDSAQNRMMAEPYARLKMAYPMTPQYAFYPSGYSGLPGEIPLDDERAVEYGEALGFADDPYLPTEDDPGGGFKPNFGRGESDEQELFSLLNPPEKQLDFYLRGLSTARNLRIAGFGGGFRSRLMLVSSRSYGRASYYAGATIDAGGGVEALGDVGNAMNALWDSILAAAKTVGEGVNGVVGLRGYLTWARDFPGFVEGGLENGKVAGLDIPERVLRNGYPNGTFVAPDVDGLLGNESWKSMTPSDDFFRLAALTRQNRELVDEVKALMQFIDDYMAMYLLDEDPGISKQDFLDWFAPERDQRVLEKLQASKRWMTANRDNEQALELIQSSLRFGPGALRVLSMLREREAQGPLAHDEAAPTGAAASAPTSSSVEDVVMAPASDRRARQQGQGAGQGRGSAARAAPTGAARAHGGAHGCHGSALARPRRRCVRHARARGGHLARRRAPARAPTSPRPSRVHGSLARHLAAALALGRGARGRRRPPHPRPPPAAPPARPARRASATPPTRRAPRRGGQTSSLLSSIFGGSSGGRAAAATPLPRPRRLPPSNPLPSPSPSAASDEGASTGTGSSGAARACAGRATAADDGAVRRGSRLRTVEPNAPVGHVWNAKRVLDARCTQMGVY